MLLLALTLWFSLQTKSQLNSSLIVWNLLGSFIPDGPVSATHLSRWYPTPFYRKFETTEECHVINNVIITYNTWWVHFLNQNHIFHIYWLYLYNYFLLPKIVIPSVSVYFNLRFVPMIGTYSLRVSISTYLIFNWPKWLLIYLEISLNANF